MSTTETDSTYAYDAFGDDADTWNIDTDGNPGISLIGRAIQVWSICQIEPVSVADASKTFRLPPSMIVEAIEDHPWMLLTGPDDDYSRLMIEHDGE